MKKLISVCYILTVLTLLLIAEKQTDRIPERVIRSEPTELERFLRHMAMRESNNTPTVVNQFGMMGKYQFARSTIKMLGYNVSPNEFLNNPKLQDTIMVANMKLNNKELNTLIKHYDGKIVKGIKITRSGILAAAHLAGPSNVASYFKDDTREGKTDANGTSIREYMVAFSRYNIRELQ